MAVKDVAEGLVGLCRNGQFDEAVTRYYADDIVSVEAMNAPEGTRGLEAVKADKKWFSENHQIHEIEVGDPFVNGDQFAVRFKMDMSENATGQRHQIEEIAMYTVANDKIVQERFFFPAAYGTGK